MYDAAKSAQFLSRLCGGEFFHQLRRAVRIFLSRLCGGEYHIDDKLGVSKFLSRLCGGE